MLPTSPEFDAAITANTTEVDCRVEIEREYNAIADSITVTADDEPVDRRFNKDNVVNIRNPKFNGIAYTPMREFFPSEIPLQGARMINDPDFDEEINVAYYIPVRQLGIVTANVTVDYAQDYEMNCLEVRYENSRTPTTFYDEVVKIFITPDGGGETQVYTGTMKTDGVTRVYYNGSTWTEVEDDKVGTGVQIRKIRVQIEDGTKEKHQPRLMYIGGLHIIDVSDDIIDVSVTKTEFEASTYLPVGDPSGNTCSISLDNTQKKYRFSDSLSNNYFLKNQKITIEFGVNTKYGGGADSFEYVAAGTYYIDSYGYDEEGMTVDISGQDFSKFLQETLCGNYLWTGKSLKYIVYDVLARSGISPRGVIFDFGVAANDNETNKRAYTWSTDEQTVWDFLSELAKSELGTVFYDEEENLVFTDRLDIDLKVNDGIQHTFSADTDLISIDEDFEVGANKIKVNYDILDVNTTKANVQLIRDKNNNVSYENGPEIPLNQIIWQPDSDESYLGSATLSRTLRPDDDYIYVSRDNFLQITRDEGEVLIGDEFIKYRDRTELPNTEGRLTIVERDSKGTVFGGTIPTHKGWYANYNIRKHTKYPHSAFPNGPVQARRIMNRDGFRQYLVSGQERYRNVVHCTEFESDQITYNSNYRVYGVRFRFNELADRWKKDYSAGLFMNLNSAKRGIFFEVTASDREGFVGENGFRHVKGNVRAYKIDDYMGPVAMPPDPADNREGFGKTVVMQPAKLSGPDKNEGTYVDITVIQIEDTGPDRIRWYVNGEFVSEFRTEYGWHYLRGLGYTRHESRVGSSICQKGRFGFFTRGSTDATVDFIYASNDNDIGPDDLLQSKGFHKYFDNHNKSWSVKRDYLQGREYYVEFGAPIHEVVNYQADHSTFPNVYARILNTDQENVTVFKHNHTPFTSDILVGNTGRIGIDLNNTVYYADGKQQDQSFFVYGLGVIERKTDEVETSHAASIRRYGIEEVEIDNPWINSRAQAISLAEHIKKFWASPQQFFDLEVLPNPALQPRDRVDVSYPEKEFTGTGVWFVNGITISYDGGLSSSVTLKRYEDYPTTTLDYRNRGGINYV